MGGELFGNHFICACLDSRCRFGINLPRPEVQAAGGGLGVDAPVNLHSEPETDPLTVLQNF
jgi:hypothetical protein